MHLAAINKQHQFDSTKGLSQMVESKLINTHAQQSLTPLGHVEDSLRIMERDGISEQVNSYYRLAGMGSLSG